METLDIITGIAGALVIISIDMLIISMIISLWSNERISRMLSTYASLLLLLAINIFLIGLLYLGITYEPVNNNTEDNCKAMFNIY